MEWERGKSMNMKCTDFENIVVDLARGLSLDATLKQQGVQHAQSCVRCAGRLKTEQALSRSLRTVAARDQLLSAPNSVETALLAAFRAQTEATTMAANVITPHFNESPLKRFFSQMKWMLVPAAAMATIVLCAVAVLRVMQPTVPSSPDSSQASGSVSATASPTVNATTPEPLEKAALPVPQEEEAPPAFAVRTRRAPTLAKAIGHQVAARQRGSRVTVDIGEFRVDEPEAISAKDFLVFDYAQTLPPADSVQLMRVRLPRERLAPLGVPLPREARNENFVNADFLVGSDGVPRAIRVANR